jgi:three-Cys-motif partner protein
MAKRIQKFGNLDTAKKQSVVVDYLASYLTAMSRQPFHLSYVDAFAGCGARVDASRAAEEQQSLALDHAEAAGDRPRAGTAIAALRLRPPFHRYVFGDLSKRHLAALSARVAEAQSAGEQIPTPEIAAGDANALVQRECDWLNGHKGRRAVMFLDPYGMQVAWSTLQAIATCPKIDLWLLLPTGIAVNRMLPWKREQHPKWAARLDAFYGCSDWRAAFMTTHQDMLGDVRQTRAMDLSGVVRFTMERLGELFGGGLYPDALALRSGRREAYHLVFASSSRDERVWKIAHGIAGHLMRKAQPGRPSHV